MCAECEENVEEVRPHLDALIAAERAVRNLYKGDSEAQHAVRLACTIVDTFHDSGHDMKALCLAYALVIQKLLAVQEIYGIPTV
jgi:hypothetical protein